MPKGCSSSSKKGFLDDTVYIVNHNGKCSKLYVLNKSLIEYSIMAEEDSSVGMYLRRLTDSSESKQRAKKERTLKRVRKYDQPFYSKSYKLMVIDN
jgi:hypothetical protein